MNTQQDLAHLLPLDGEATYNKYIALNYYVSQMPVRPKRLIFRLTRGCTNNTNIYFPKYGITAGEFTTFNLLNENTRRGTNSKPIDN